VRGRLPALGLALHAFGLGDATVGLSPDPLLFALDLTNLRLDTLFHGRWILIPGRRPRGRRRGRRRWLRRNGLGLSNRRLVARQGDSRAADRRSRRLNRRRRRGRDRSELLALARGLILRHLPLCLGRFPARTTAAPATAPPAAATLGALRRPLFAAALGLGLALFAVCEPGRALLLAGELALLLSVRGRTGRRPCDGRRDGPGLTGRRGLIGRRGLRRRHLRGSTLGPCDRRRCPGRRRRRRGKRLRTLAVLILGPALRDAHDQEEHEDRRDQAADEVLDVVADEVPGFARERIRLSHRRHHESQEGQHGREQGDSGAHGSRSYLIRPLNSRSTSRRTSLSAISRRRSRPSLPRASASSTLARGPLK